MLLRFAFLAAATTCLFASGCGPAKLDVSKEWDMDGEPQMLYLNPESKPQKVTVEFESSGNEVTVLLIKSADVPKEDERFVAVEKAIASQKGKSGSFSGDVPEKTETQVIVRGGGKTKVKLRVHNK